MAPEPDADRTATRTARASLARDLVVVLAFGAVGMALVAGFATYRIWSQGSRDEQQPVDAVVVLGAAQYDGRPSPVFAARIDHAVELWKDGVAPWLVVTGGKQDGDRATEAQTARAYAIANGVAEDAILVEDQSRSTYESLAAVAGMLRERGLDRVVVVSDPTHMLRSLRIATDQGLVAYGSPTRTSPIDQQLERRLRATIHELGALAMYFFRGGAGQPS
jgi:uncharacterized SAM-binding protein YcdF (DUF218 family)